METRESAGYEDVTVRVGRLGSLPAPPRMLSGNGSWRATQLILLTSGCFLQVQEKCDYDLVTPLALLFYYAVLYVSPQGAARSSIPARGEARGPAEPRGTDLEIGVAFI